jgi:hypothetical protein
VAFVSLNDAIDASKRYLSLVTGFPVLFDERDITQLYPSVPTASSVSRGVSDDARSLIGALAHIKFVPIQTLLQWPS